MKLVMQKYHRKHCNILALDMQDGNRFSTISPFKYTAPISPSECGNTTTRSFAAQNSQSGIQSTGSPWK